MAKFRTIVLILMIQGIFFLYPYCSLGQWDNDRIKPPSPSVLLGIRGGYDWNVKSWNLGAQVRVPLSFLGRGGTQIIPSGDVFFLRDGIDWQFNLDIALRLMIFYGGAGLAYLNRNLNIPDEKPEKTGINYFIGMPLPIPIFPAMLFIEARWTQVKSEHLFRLMAGLNFSLGGRRR